MEQQHLQKGDKKNVCTKETCTPDVRETTAAGASSCVMQAGLRCDRCGRCASETTTAEAATADAKTPRPVRKRGRPPRKAKPDPNAPRPAPKPLLPAPWSASLSSLQPVASSASSSSMSRSQADVDYDDDDGERPPQKLQRQTTQTTTTTTTTVSVMVPSVLQMLVNELQDAQRSVRSARRDASLISSRQRHLSDMQHDLEQQLDALPLAQTSSSPSSSSSYSGRYAFLSSPLSASPPPLYPTLAHDWEALFPHLTDAARRARRQCLRQFPFLDRYNLDRRDDVPFVIDDLRKPVTIARFVPGSTPEELITSVLVYSNPAFCELIEYELNELQGCSTTKFAMPDHTLLPLLLQQVAHRTHSHVSGVMAFWTLVRAKSGTVYRIRLRWQVFLDDDGNILWTIGCSDRAELARANELQAYSPLRIAGNPAILHHVFPTLLPSLPSLSSSTSSPPPPPAT